MAVCEENLSRFVRARALTDQYLAKAKDALGETEQTEAEQFAASLRSFVAVVTIATTPAGAIVFVDDEERGKSPLSLELDMGERKLRAALAGHKELARDERFDGASERKLAWTMEPHDSRLSVNAARSHAIAINGRAVGVTSWSGVLAPGAYQVDVSGAGYKPRHTDLTLAPSETRTLDGDLEPEAQHASRWPWIVGIGLALVGAGSAAISCYDLPRPSAQLRRRPRSDRTSCHEHPTPLRDASSRTLVLVRVRENRGAQSRRAHLGDRQRHGTGHRL